MTDWWDADPVFSPDQVPLPRRNPLGRLQPEFRTKFADLRTAAGERGAYFDAPTGGLGGVRTQEQQDALYAQGRTRPGNIVTQTRNSNHIGGRALDVVPREGTTAKDVGDALTDLTKNDPRFAGMRSGATFFGLYDPLHVELNNPQGTPSPAQQQPAAIAQAPNIPLQAGAAAQAQPAAAPANWWANDPVAKPKPDVGRGRAALEGYLSGASGNFSDEVYGASKASGLPEILGGFRAPVGAARLAYEHLTGQPGDATKTYDQAVAEKRGVQQTAQEQYPGTYLAGNVGGAVVLPTGRLMTAATLPGRIGQGAAVGAGYGAIAGAGEGTTVEDRLSRGAVGGATGAAVGAAAAPVVEGALQLGRAAINPVINAVRGAFNPQNEASRRVVTALQRDAQADPNAVNRLTPGEYRAEYQAGNPVAVMDMGGETTRALARSAANTSPEGRQALNTTINDRYESQAGRVSAWFRNTFNFPNARAQQEAIDQAERTVNRANYARAYHEGRNTLQSPGLDQLATAPAVQDAMRAAARNVQDRAVTSGQGPGTSANNLQFWDHVRRELTDGASAARRAGRNEEAGRLTGLANNLNRELDRLVPSYQQARAGAARFFGAENALEAGQNFVRQNLANPEARRALAQMTPTERQLFQDGFVSRYIESLNGTGDRRNILNQIANSPQAREKLQIALGPQRAGELEARLRVEGIMDLARGAVQGNSTTARQLAELGFAGGAGSLGAYGAYNIDPAQMTYAAVAGALLAGRRGIDQRVSRQVAQMLVSADPQVVQRGVQLVARNGRMMDALRTADRRIAVVGGGQGAAAPAIQATPAITRADE